MSLNLEKNRARMTVSLRGWNDVVIDSGEGETEEGDVLEDYVNDLEYDPTSDPDFSMDDIPGYDPDTGLDYDLTYDFGENFNWDALAEDLDINLDLDGYIDVDQMESLTQEIANLANNEEAIYNYMTDHGDSSGIPARIRVTNPPDKLEYSSGEEIDFSGIIVCAYSSLTTRTPFIRQEWDGPRHNQIPFDQLTLPTSMAEGEMAGQFPTYRKSGSVTVSSLPSARELFDATLGLIEVSISYDVSDYWEWAFEDFFVRAEELFYDCSFFVRIYAEPTSTGVIAYIDRSGGAPVGWTQRLGTNIRSYERWFLYGTKSGSSITVTDMGQNTIVTGDFKCFIGASYDLETGAAYTSNIDLVISAVTGTVEIPVQWQTEYREEPYEASFEIQVT